MNQKNKLSRFKKVGITFCALVLVTALGATAFSAEEIIADTEAASQVEEAGSFVGSEAQSLPLEGGEPVTGEEQQENAPQAPVLAYDPQPTAVVEIDPALLEEGKWQSPRWEFPVEDEFIPVGWAVAQQVDQVTGAAYWVLVQAPMPMLMAAATVHEVSNYAELAAAVQLIVDSGVAGSISISQDIAFGYSKSISIAKAADISFFSATGQEIVFTGSGNPYFRISAPATQVSLRFDGLVVMGTKASGSAIEAAAEDMRLYNAVVRGVKSSMGAIRIYEGNLTLDGCLLENNDSINGAVFMNKGALTLLNTEVINNTGRGIYIEAAANPFSFVMENSTVEGNSGKSSGAAGIGIIGSNVTVNVKNSSISNNTTTGGVGALLYGGGMRVTAPSDAASGDIVVNIENTTISGNATLGGDEGWGQTSWGGAGLCVLSRNTGTRFTDTVLTNVNVTTTITGSVFSSNKIEDEPTSYYGGGGQGSAIFTDGRLTVAGSTFEGNSANTSGAVSLEVGAKNGAGLTVTAAGSTPTVFKNNKANAGAAIATNFYDYWGKNSPVIPVNIQDTVFEKNTAAVYGSAIYFNETYSNSTTQINTIKNCSFIENTCTSTSGGSPSAAIAISGYNSKSYPVFSIENSVFKNNSGYQQGGAVFIASGTRLQVSGSEFTGNSVATEDKYGKGGGGALFFEDLNSMLEIKDTSFSKNYAPKGYVATTTAHDYKLKNILSVTAPFSHVLNNLDINYISGTPAQLVTVTFVARDDAGSTLTQQVISGKAALKPSETFEKENYTFTGWYTDEAATTQWDFSTPITGNKTLYGGWLLNEYTVSFDLNGAPGAEIKPQTVLENTFLTQPNAPEWEGRVFGGWFTEEGLLWNFEENRVTKSQTLYAQWQRQYVVAFETNGGSAVESQTVAEGSLAGKPAAPVKEGYTFEGWHKNSGLSALWDFDTDRVTESTTLYAAWQEIPVISVIASYRIMYDVNWGGYGTTQIEDQTGYLAGQAATLRGTVPVRGGYTFTGWNTGASGEGTSYSPGGSLTLGSADVRLYAQWRVNGASSSEASRPASSEVPAASSIASSSQTAGASSAASSSGAIAVITGGTSPLSGGGSSWGLLNAILTIGGLLFALVLIIAGLAHRNRQQQVAENEEIETANRRNILWRLLAGVTALGSLAVFLLTQDLSLPMAFTDSWTILMAILFVVEIVFAAIAIKASRTPKQNKRVNNKRVSPA